MHGLVKKQKICYAGGLAYVQQKPTDKVGKPGNEHTFEGTGLGLSRS